MIRIGTAGWAIPRAVAGAFPAHGTALERYAARFDAAEINSSFHRPHRPATYVRWAAAVPERFRFSVKLPKAITHERRLVDVEPMLRAFLHEVSFLGTKLGPLLVQLPPSFAFNGRVAGAFLGALRALTGAMVACEPRHASWFEPTADRLLNDHRVARVVADPAIVPAAAVAGGWLGLAYFRLHGSPRMYYSSYDADFLAGLAVRLRAADADEVWCVFDNTTSGAAADNALILQPSVAPMLHGRD